MASIPGYTPKTTPRSTHGSGDFGPRRGAAGQPLGQMADRARADRADPLRAKVYADPKIRDPEAFLVWLGRRKGGLNSHKGRSKSPGPGTRRLAQMAHNRPPHPQARTPAPAQDAPTMRLSRQQVARAVQVEAPTVVLRRPPAPRPARVTAARLPVREAPTQPLKLPLSQAGLAAQAKGHGAVWTASHGPRAPEPDPELPKLPPELAKLRVGNVKVGKNTKISKRWKLGRRQPRSTSAKGL